MKRGIACFANVQEGRNALILSHLANIANSIPGCKLVRLFSDHTFHRSGFLLAGSPDAVGMAAVALTREAVKSIDLVSPDRISDMCDFFVFSLVLFAR